MEIAIKDSKYIKDLQDEFQREYPFLKIEFFKGSHKNGTPISRSQAISGRMTIGMVRHTHAEGVLDINGSRTVKEVESDFQNQFGLSAQVFRKSGNLWIETTLTDHWSLLRQNLEGQQMS